MKKIFFLIISFTNWFLIAQTPISIPILSIEGERSVKTEEVFTYTINAYNLTIVSGNWFLPSGGVIINETENSITIRWEEPGGTTISYSADTYSEGNIIATLGITVIDKDTPLPPPTPIIKNLSCSTAILAHSRQPIKGVSYYWQGTNSYGTSIINSNYTYTVNESGTYYLRARHDEKGLWSYESCSIEVDLTKATAIWYDDSDNDGLGNVAITKISCNKPSGYVSNFRDRCPSIDGRGSTNGCND